MKTITLRGVLFWPFLPTIGLIVVIVGLEPNHGFPPELGVWVVAFYEVCVVAWAAWRAHRTGSSLLELFGPREPRKHVALVGWAVLAYFSLVVGGEQALSDLWVSGLRVFGLPLPGPAAPDPTRWDEIPAFVVLAVVLAPAVEELLLRGLTFRVLRRWWGLLPALAGQAIIFGFLHDQGMVWKVILGGFLGILVLRSGTLFASWATHLTINFIATAFVIAGVIWAQGFGEAGSAAGLAAEETGGEWVRVMFFAVGLWATYRFLRDTQDAWNPRRRSENHRFLLWSLTRRYGRRPLSHGGRAPRRFFRRVELPPI